MERARAPHQGLVKMSPFNRETFLLPAAAAAAAVAHQNAH